MIRKHQNYTMQTNPRHSEEKTQTTKSQDIRKTDKVEQTALSFPSR